MDDFLNLLNQVWTSGFLGINMSQVLVTIAIFIVSLILRGIFANLGIKTLKRFTSKTKTDLDDILLESLKRPLGFIPITIGFYLITIYLPLEGLIDLVATNVVKALIVYTSTRQVYGKPKYLPVDENHPINPPDINGIHKFAAEQYHNLFSSIYGLRTVILRLTNTYGPRMRIKDAKQTFLGVWIKNLISFTKIQNQLKYWCNFRYCTL